MVSEIENETSLTAQGPAAQRERIGPLSTPSSSRLFTKPILVNE